MLVGDEDSVGVKEGMADGTCEGEGGAVVISCTTYVPNDTIISVPGIDKSAGG